MRMPTATEALRGLVITLLISLVPLTLTIVMPLANGQPLDTAGLVLAIVGSLLLAAVIYIVALYTRHLQKKVGKLTGYAALAGTVAVVTTALAMALQVCPGSLTGQACTVPEAASWGLSSALLIVLIAMIYASASLTISFFKWVAHKITKYRERVKARKAEDQRKETDTLTLPKGKRQQKEAATHGR